MSFLPPLIGFDAITLDELNAALVAWHHRMGPLTRPPEYGCWTHGLRHDGKLVAVASANTIIRETCAGIDRNDAIELSRLCADRSGLCRVALRLWREFVFRPLAAARRAHWAVSYQDADVHTGRTYRFDGWRVIGHSAGGSVDQRTGRRGRRKRIWGWCEDADLLRARAVQEEP